jgi:hypothetical protein
MKRIGKAFADVDPEEIEREAVKAVREVRKEMAAERRASRNWGGLVIDPDVLVSRASPGGCSAGPRRCW